MTSQFKPTYTKKEVDTLLLNVSGGGVGPVGPTGPQGPIGPTGPQGSSANLGQIPTLSGNWNSTYTTVNTNSASWGGGTVDLGEIPSLSSNWNSTYTTVNANSASQWNYQGTDIKSLTADWVGGNSAWTTVNANSASWSSGGSDVSLLSGNWQSTWTTVNANSAVQWNYQGSDLKALSSDWVGGNSAYTTTNTNSAKWESNWTTTNSNSANWQSTCTVVQTNSAAWILSGSDVDLGEIPALSGNWNSTYTTVNANSASWGTGTVDLGEIPSLSGNWNSSYTTTNTNSGNWNSTFTTVNTNSASWGGGTVDLGEIPTLSGNWNSTYTTVNTNSANWELSYISGVLINNSFFNKYIEGSYWNNQAICVGIFPSFGSYTLVKTQVTTMGTSSPILVYNIDARLYGSYNTSGTNVFSTSLTARNTGDEQTAFTYSSIASSSGLFLTTATGAATGTLTSITTYIEYRKN